MRTLAAIRRARVWAAAALAASLLTGVPVAHADSTSDAVAKAQGILARVHRLQAQVAAAERDYGRALAGVASSVNASIETDRARQQVVDATQSAQAAVDDQVRQLYMSGGPVALYASLLSSGNVSDFQNGAALVSQVVSAGRDVVAQDSAVVATARVRARDAAHLASRRIQTERSVAQVAARVATLLTEQRQLLDEANARVTRLQELDAARAALAAQSAAFGSITSTQLATLHVLPPSAAYLALYHHAAATCAGLSWTVLAAIGQVESGHGRNPSTSYAGAMGPMQFLPSTFASYAVDGDGDGRSDIMDPADAIFTAARYLCANGAGRGPQALAAAVFHYNHADWYVQMVLTLAKQYAG